MAWLLMKQAGIASEKLSALYADNGIDQVDLQQVESFLEDNRDAAFYHGKLTMVRYYYRNHLPEFDLLSMIIMQGDMTVSEMRIDSY